MKHNSIMLSVSNSLIYLSKIWYDIARKIIYYDVTGEQIYVSYM